MGITFAVFLIIRMTAMFAGTMKRASATVLNLGASLTDQEAEVTFRMQQMVASVQLIKALGGGWDASQIPSPKDLGKSIPDGSRAKR